MLGLTQSLFGILNPGRIQLRYEAVRARWFELFRS